MKSSSLIFQSLPFPQYYLTSLSLQPKLPLALTNLTNSILVLPSNFTSSNLNPRAVLFEPASPSFESPLIVQPVTLLPIMALTKQIARNGTGGTRPKKSLARFIATRPGKKVLFKKKGSLKKSGRSKYKSETVLERKLRSWQGTRSSEMAIPERPFQGLVSEVIQDLQKPNLRFERSLLGSMQECAESYLVGVLEDTNLCAILANRVIIHARDMQLALRMRAEAAAVTTDSPSATSSEPEALESSERIASVED